MTPEMKTDLNVKHILRSANVRSIVWVLICLVYISYNVGWENLLYLMPHEIAAMVIGIISPIFIFIILSFISKAAGNERKAAEEMLRHGDLIKDISGKIGEITNETRENGKFLIKELEARKAISGEVVNAIENQNTGMEDIANKLSVVIKSDREKLDRIDPKDVNQLSALIGLINMVLADISVSATQLLVQLMEEGRRDKREIKEFVSGLVEAYSTGDKNVFFRALKQQLADNPTRVKALQSLSGSSPEVRRDIARILKEMREIITLVNRCDKDNLIRIVFEGGDVWALHEVLKPHFKMDGTAAKT
jgi:hypothetical protein